MQRPLGKYADRDAEVDQVAGDAGVPQQADGAINDVVDKKVNSEIPGGN